MRYQQAIYHFGWRWTNYYTQKILWALESVCRRSWQVCFFTKFKLVHLIAMVDFFVEHNREHICCEFQVNLASEAKKWVDVVLFKFLGGHFFIPKCGTPTTSNLSLVVMCLSNWTTFEKLLNPQKGQKKPQGKKIEVNIKMAYSLVPRDFFQFTCRSNVVLGLRKLIFVDGPIELNCHFESLKFSPVTTSLALNVCATVSYNLRMFSTSKAPSLFTANNSLPRQQRYTKHKMLLRLSRKSYCLCAMRLVLTWFTYWAKQAIV